MKVLLVGEFGSGKTRAFNKLLGLPKAEKYTPTNGANVAVYKNNTEIWEVAGHPDYQGLRDGYFIGADICFIFGKDLSWIRDLARTVPDAKIYLYSGFDDFKAKIDSLTS
jgi:GTPase SAR1 family protein